MVNNWTVWDTIKTECPAIAEWLRKEHARRNGFLPYEQGYIYVIHGVGSSYYKIGKSVNPDRRILQIAPQMPFRTRFIRVWRSDFMSMAELFMHEQYSECRVNGEWFEFSAKELECFFMLQMEDMIRYNYGEFVISTLSKIAPKELNSLWEKENAPFCVAGRGADAIATIQYIFDRISFEVDPGPPPDIVSLLYFDNPLITPKHWQKGGDRDEVV